MAIPFERLVKEDLNLGYGSVSVTMPAGGSATGTKVGLHTLMDDVFNVLHFGAVGDGVTNDTAAIQAAINAANGSANGRGAVYFPPTGLGGGNTYRAVGLVLTSKPIKLFGPANRGVTLLLHSDTDHLIKAEHPTAVTGITLQDLMFHCLDSTTYDCFYSTRMELFSFIRCSFTHCRYGVHLDTDSRMGNIVECIFGTGCQTGLRMEAGCHYNSIIGCWFDENDARGIYCNSRANAFVGNTFLDNTDLHMYLDSLAHRNTISGNTFTAGNTVGMLECYGDNNIIVGNTGDAHSGNELSFGAGAADNIVGQNNFIAAAIADGGTRTRVFGLYDASGNLRMDTGSQSTVGAAGGASALPATPSGYLIINFGGGDVVMPYYAKT